MHLDLVTTDGPSWKPLPILFTAPFSLVGDGPAPELWLLVARAGGLLAIAMAFRLAARLAGPVAGVIAAVALALADEFVRNFARGNSEGLLVAFCLLALERHLDGRRRDAFLLGFLAGLLRPEVWPLWGLYGLWLVAVEWRGRPPWRTIALVGGTGLLTLRRLVRARVPGLGLDCCAPPSARSSPTRTPPRSPPRRSSRSSAARRRSCRSRSTSAPRSRVVLAVWRRGRTSRGGGDARGALDGADGRRRADDRGRLRRQPALRRAARRDGLHPRRRGLGRPRTGCVRRRWTAAPRRPRWRSSRWRPPRRSSSPTSAHFGTQMDRLAWEADLYGANLKAMIAKAGGERALKACGPVYTGALPDPGGRVVPAPARDRRRDLPGAAGHHDRAPLHGERARSALPDGHQDRRAGWSGAPAPAREHGSNLLSMATIAPRRPAWSLPGTVAGSARLRAPLAVGGLVAAVRAAAHARLRRRLLDRRGPLGRDRRPAAGRHPGRAAARRLAAALLRAPARVDLGLREHGDRHARALAAVRGARRARPPGGRRAALFGRTRRPGWPRCWRPPTRS